MGNTAGKGEPTSRKWFWHISVDKTYPREVLYKCRFMDASLEILIGKYGSESQESTFYPVLKACLILIIITLDFEQNYIRLFSYFWLCHVACGMLVPWPGVEPMPPAFEAWCHNYCMAREILVLGFGLSKVHDLSQATDSCLLFLIVK